MAEIWGAEDKTHALAAVKAFVELFGAKFGKAVAKITDDLDELLAFYDYPAEHWVHLRTTDENVNAGPVISLFSHTPTQLPLSCDPQPRSRWSAPAGGTTLTAARTAVASGCGGRGRPPSEEQTGDWKCCRAA